MVIGRYPSWPRTLGQVGQPLALFIAFAVLITFLEERNHPFKAIPFPDITLSLLAVALGVLLAFRTNSAYARWWEARQLWGGLVNGSRSLARQAMAFGVCGEKNGEAAQIARRLIFLQIAYVHALRCALRNQQPWTEIEPYLDPASIADLKTRANVPYALIQQMGKCMADAANDNVLTEWRLARMDATLSEITDAQGGCERIKNTPMPLQYDYFPELFVKAYCLLVPAVLVEELGWLTPVATTLVSFVLLVMNRIGKNLEDPFENRVYDVPMTALSRTIELDLLQALNEQKVPAPMPPVRGVLW